MYRKTGGLHTCIKICAFMGNLGAADVVWGTKTPAMKETVLDVGDKIQCTDTHVFSTTIEFLSLHYHKDYLRCAAFAQ